HAFMLAATWPNQIKSDGEHVSDGTCNGNRPPAGVSPNITIQFCSNFLPVEREEAGNPHPCVSVSIRGQIACFLWRSVSFRSLVFGPRMDTGYTRIECLGFTETIY